MQKNHLSGLKRRLLKLVFWNETHMADVRRECQALVRRNRYKAGSGTAAYDVAAGERGTRERIQARDTASAAGDSVAPAARPPCASSTLERAYPWLLPYHGGIVLQRFS